MPTYDVWTTLSSFHIKYFSIPHNWNNSEFVLIPVAINSKHCKGKGLYKYNIINSKWSKLIDYKKSLKISKHSSVYDDINKIIYIYNGKYQNIITVDLNAKNSLCQLQIHKISVDIGINPALIIIENVLHIIGGSKSNKHYKWNKNKNELTLLCKISTQIKYGIFSNGVIHLLSSNELLLFGGCVSLKYTFKSIDTIYRYDIYKNKWKKMKNFKLPIPLDSFGYITNKKDIIIFGGRYDNTNSDDIYLMNVHKRSIRKSGVKCPLKGSYHAIITKDSKTNSLINGYINWYWNLFKLNDKEAIPLVLSILIEEYYAQKYGQYVHLLKLNSGNHWKIELNTVYRRQT